MYRPEYSDMAAKIALLGATDKDLAEIFGVCETTINTWKHEHIEFSEALKKGKYFADANVAEKLYQRALGYSHASEKIFNSDGSILRAETIEHYPPDTTAAIFWLKNRQPDKWRDKQHIDQTVTQTEAPTEFASPEEAARAYAEAVKGQ